MYKRTFYVVKLSREQGTTFIELLLSLTLSLLLLGLLSIIYVATEVQNEALNTLSTVHEHSRFVLQSLQAELQAAGFIGCPYLNSDFPLNNATAHSLQAKNKIDLQQDRLGSSVMTVRHRRLKATILHEPMTHTSILKLGTGYPVAPGEVLLISDCRHADLFQVEKVIKQRDWQTLITRRPLRYHYEKNAEIGQLEINTYAVEKTNRQDESGQAIFSLYKTDITGHKMELVEGIQKLKLKVLQKAKKMGISIELQARQKKLIKSEYGFATLRNSSA